MENTTVAPAQLLSAQFVERKSEFQAILPANCSFERFSRIAKTAILQTPDLLIADRASLFLACFKCAQDGLLPDGREAALVIYNNKQKDGTYKKHVQYMPMFSGILKKVRNSVDLSSISAHVVYENDEFSYELGDEESITHKPKLGDRGKPVCVYAIVRTRDNAIYRDVMSFTDIEKIRSISKARDGQAWKEHWGEMAKKTVIRRISKLLPMSADVEQVIRRDDEMFEFNNSSHEEKQIIDISNAIEAEIVQEDTQVKKVQAKPKANMDELVTEAELDALQNLIFVKMDAIHEKNILSEVTLKKIRQCIVDKEMKRITYNEIKNKIAKL